MDQTVILGTWQAHPSRHSSQIQHSKQVTLA